MIACRLVLNSSDDIFMLDPTVFPVEGRRMWSMPSCNVLLLEKSGDW
jgi:hypothetical protein